jgi:hypothetical protein
MSADVLNTAILSVLLAAAVGGGYYVTQRVQPAELEAVEADIEALENRDAQVETLLVEEAAASESAAATLAQWNTRYKVLPSALTSAEVVAYLNALSSRGFHRFDLALSGVTPGPVASTYTYQVTGEAYFESLFAFVWHLENGRGLYRVRDLQVTKEVVTIGGEGEGPGRQVVLASFSMSVDAFYSSDRDISAPEGAVAPPPEAFPARRAAVNPFFPFVLDALPPNADDLVEVGSDPLVSVVGGTAVFSRGGQLRQLRAGDRVYLGRVSDVDPRLARVTVDLNKGGLRERVEVDLETGEERYRQHLGGPRVSPSATGPVPAGPALDEAPPAPGTPEALEAGTYQAAPVDASAVDA